MIGEGLASDPFPRPGRPPPPRTAQPGSAAAGRHRRSMGQSVSDVVESQLVRSRSREDGGGTNGGFASDSSGGGSRRSSVGGGYQPSFGPRATVGARDLEDVNEALEARLRTSGSRQVSREDGGSADFAAGGAAARKGSGILIADLGSRPRPRAGPASGGNSLVQIGTAAQQAPPPPPSTAFPGARRGLATGGNPTHPRWNNEAEPKAGQFQQQPGFGATNRKLSLGLSYGPITSSLDDQAALRKRMNGNSRPVMTGGGLNSSMRAQPRRSSLHQPSSRAGGGGGILNGSIERSWKQQVEAATARVAARPSRLINGTQQVHQRQSVFGDGPQEDGYYHFPPGSTAGGAPGPAAAGGRRKSSLASAMPNTLTLDNWFGTSGGGDRIPEGDGGGGSNSSSRRNSGLAPLPDVDFPSFDGASAATGAASMELRELDDGDANSLASTHVVRPAMLLPRGGRPFSLELATSLRVLIFGGAARSFPAGWLNQAFSFSPSPQLRYGLRQARGGPCGVLAAVQAHLARALCFGLPPVDDTTRAVDPLRPTEAERSRALAAALARVLTRCAESGVGAGGVLQRPTFVVPSPKTHFHGVGRYRADGITETLTIHECANVGEALAFAQDNIGFFSSEGNHAVICFLYSCLLTRGIANVSADMDSQDLPLMGAHGYCSQEMVNLMLTGRAVSNTFDGVMTLEGDLKGGGDSTKLKGIDERADVGLLSLFEHYMSTTVGEHLKTPLSPVWVVCSESHFSVLFSTEDGVEAAGRADREPIRLVYYDGLARQESPIILTVDCSHFKMGGGRGYGGAGGSEAEDEDLVPPLEHCIRTKWRDATVDWNGSERILRTTSRLNHGATFARIKCELRTTVHP